MSADKRRKFLKNASILAGTVLSGSLVSACNQDKIKSVQIQKKSKTYNWRCVTVWPPNFPVLGTGVVDLAKELEILSEGRLKIQVYGSGELVPALESFDAVQLGGVQMAHGASYYWGGKMPSAVFFCAIPFGMTASQMNSWILYGGGWKLWKELYDKVGLIPFPCGNTGVQMGGWFNKEINSIEDYNGLKMRMPGLGGKVLAKAGGAAVTVPGGEIYTNLERGVIDATEWIGPYHDYLMGFHKIAKYYYYPGWHEPGPMLELVCNKKAYESLPKELQQMIETVSLKYNTSMRAEFDAMNNLYLNKIMEESDVQLKAFPDQVMQSLKQISEEVIGSLVENDPFSQKVFKSYAEFRKNISTWEKVSEKPMGLYM
ncbi:TRAP transporter substrate-binding protein [Sediminitomix flava]|uniref:TRAP-type mannitol/chloroaromatic compound transport system substrate-binding protein n=1 Tax=Sediminitomix flava TaxID=379075 RepID=A0A315ZAA9_SEDFL|nr:TRAP transporter substrate-binding protein [Sediminitomix flava]PWJ42099.1 TRAP-type mannitol/chloroaromatic compound transport system substrate-binding protein [Sediminitomix flava]